MLQCIAHGLIAKSTFNVLMQILMEENRTLCCMELYDDSICMTNGTTSMV